jgi:uncharacterized membrane protein
MRATTRASKGLWILQGLLAALFLFAGVMKFVMPAAQLAAQSPLPVGFIHFIGVMEILGACGLVLPGVVRILPVLTPLAAAGLVIIMVGATAVTLAIGGGAGALFPAVVGAVATVVALGRWRVVPLRTARA